MNDSPEHATNVTLVGCLTRLGWSPEQFRVPAQRDGPYAAAAAAGDSRLQLRELDGACRAATEAATIVRRLDSAHKLSRLAEFRKAAQPYANTTQVRDFDAKFGDLLSSTAA